MKSGKMVLALALVALLASARGAVADPLADACAATKSKASGKKSASKLTCYAKAASKATTVDSTCLAKAEVKFSVAFAKAEAKGGCATTSDTAKVECAVDHFYDEVAGALHPNTVSFSADIQPIFTSTCATALCHSGGTPQAGMNLTAGNAYAAIVNVTSSTAFAPCGPIDRVEPGQPQRSFMLVKLHGCGPCFSGSKMPQTGSLSLGDLQLIAAWIAQGAPNN